ncbi:Co-chaperone protein DjlA [subsurface metagenome]
MAHRKRKTELQDAFDAIAGFRDLVDETFEKLTGKSIAVWLKEFQQQPRELPGGEQAAPQQEPAMPLADAYAVLGLPPTASMEEVKRNYKHLAAVFHPDKGGYTEAMVLLNQAYERIQKHRSGSH